jgi:hypothetical protein
MHDPQRAKGYIDVVGCDYTGVHTHRIPKRDTLRYNALRHATWGNLDSTYSKGRIMTTTAVSGIIGCGNISSIYLKNLHQRFRGITVAAVADIDVERAQARAAEFGVAKGCSVEELSADRQFRLSSTSPSPPLTAKSPSKPSPLANRSTTKNPSLSIVPTPKNAQRRQSQRRTRRRCP